MSPDTALDDEVHARVVHERSADVVAAARRHAHQLAPLLPDVSLDALVDRVVSRVHGLGALEPYLADPMVTEVMVNAGADVWVEREGRLERAPVQLSPAATLHVIERIVAPLGLRVDRTTPIVDARLPDGSRVHAIVPPLAVDGPCVSIRRFRATPVTLDELAPGAAAPLLRWAVHARVNVLVSGATSSGKTTLLNAMAAEIGPNERVVTIEDAAELRLPGNHVVRLECRAPTAESLGGGDLRALVRAALRMRPDRIVVGEVRGAEALDMVQAMSTGHDGALSTLHAGSPEEALRRLDAMVLQAEAGLPLDAVRQQVHAAVDLVVQVARRHGGRRTVTEIAEVTARPPDGLALSRAATLVDGESYVRVPERRPRAVDARPPPSLRRPRRAS